MRFLPLPSVEVGMTNIIDYVMARHDGTKLIKETLCRAKKLKNEVVIPSTKCEEPQNVSRGTIFGNNNKTKIL